METERQAELRLNLKGLSFLHVHVPLTDAAGHPEYTLRLLEEPRETSLSIEAPVSELFQEVASRLAMMVAAEIRTAIGEHWHFARIHEKK